MKRIFSLVLAAALCGALPGVASAAMTIPAESDFFTTPWAFGPPYVRDAGRDVLGVTSADPFLSLGEETTYFTFNFNPADFSGPVANARLWVEMTDRSSFASYPTANDPFAVSAHRVLDDPTTIDPALASGPGSFVEFANTQIGGVEDTKSVTGPAIVSWNVTSLVNEWITNGDANVDYAIAMTGRVGNPPDTEDRGAFFGFINSEGGLGGLSARIIIPEPATVLLLGLGAVAFIRRRHA